MSESTTRPAPAARPELAARLALPFAAPRPGQDVMLRDVADAFDSGLRLLCSAPTGIGKTAAALFPALRLALREGLRVFFATAKNSQQELALDTLRRLIPPKSGGCAVQIVAKERSCPLDGRRCREPRCAYQDRFAERLAESLLLERLEGRGVVAGASVREQALALELCPFETSLALAERAHVVVSDFNYVFEPNVYLRRFFDAPHDCDLLIVDEAHNLPARAVGYHSPELEIGALEQAAAAALAAGGSAARAAGVALSALVDACHDTVARLVGERDAPAPWVEAPERTLLEPLGERIEDAGAGYRAFLAAGGKPPPGLSAAPGVRAGRDPLRAVLFAARDFCRAGTGDPERFTAIWSPERAKVLCLDPAPELRARLSGFHAALLMSATLTPFEFHQRRLGADGPAALTLDLPSPFPRERRLLASVSSVDTTFRRRAEDAPRIAQLIEETVALRTGNYLAFFSSFAYRDQVVAHLGRGSQRVLLQIPGMPAESALGLLRDNPGETRILCAVHGGIFAEGVDYPGDMAIGVFVVGPGLPAVSPEQELVRSYYETRLGAGFEYAYVNPGLERVVQAGGRAIRTPDDRAFVLLLGRRFSEPLYRDRLPAYWREELIDSDDPVPLVRAFWQSADVAAQS